MLYVKLKTIWKRQNQGKPMNSSWSHWGGGGDLQFSLITHLCSSKYMSPKQEETMISFVHGKLTGMGPHNLEYELGPM